MFYWLTFGLKMHYHLYKPDLKDAIILAGLGVHIMIKILTGKNTLDELNMNYLFLQPTNPQLKHLLMF